jgi:hypothetical protein
MEIRNNQGKLLVTAFKVRKLLLKFLKDWRYRIGPFAVLKSFLICEITLYNNKFFLQSEDIVLQILIVNINFPPPPGRTAILPEYIHYYGYYYQVIVQC